MPSCSVCLMDFLLFLLSLGANSSLLWDGGSYIMAPSPLYTDHQFSFYSPVYCIVNQFPCWVMTTWMCVPLPSGPVLPPRYPTPKSGSRLLNVCWGLGAVLRLSTSTHFSSSHSGKWNWPQVQLRKQRLRNGPWAL